MQNWQTALSHFNRQPTEYAKKVAIDCETTGVHLHHDSMPFMVCATFDDGTCLTWEGDLDPQTRKVYWSKEQQQELAELINHSDWLYIFTNAKFDIRCLSRIIPDFDPDEFMCRCHDTLPMHHVFHNAESHALKDAAIKYADIPDKDEKALHQAVRDAKHLALQLNLPWAFASKTTCPQQTKAPNKGWAVMDMWLPKALMRWQWENSDSFKLLAHTVNSYDCSGQFANLAHMHQERIRKTDGWQNSPPEINPSAHPWWTVCQEYCAYDTLRSLVLYDGFESALKEQFTYDPLTREKRSLWQVYLENSPAFSISYNTEEAGLTYDPKRCQKEKDKLTLDLIELQQCVSLTLNKYTTFKPSSSAQIRTVLYDQFKLPVTRRTKPSKKKSGDGWGGSCPTTDEDFICELLKIFCPEDPGLYRAPAYQRGVETYAEYRKRLMKWHELVTTSGEGVQLFCFCLYLLLWKKTSSTITKLKGYIHAGIQRRLHPSLNPIGAKTPRYSSSNPNAQNISKGGKSKVSAIIAKPHPILRQSLRGFFGPLPGREWWSIDYQQLQLVIAASLFQSTKMLEQLAAGFDFHTAMAKIIFATNSPTDDERRITKNVNFGFWFGAGEEKVELTCGVPGIYPRLATLFPEVPENLDRMSWQVRREGYVVTLGGYRLYVPEDTPYAGCVYAVQGSEGVLVKRATYMVQHWLETTPAFPVRSSRVPNVQAQPVDSRRVCDDIGFNLFLHDELDFDCLAGCGTSYIPTIIDIMQKAALSLGVPARAIAKYHPITWADAAVEEFV